MPVWPPMTLFSKIDPIRSISVTVGALRIDHGTLLS
eukprot:CAMPEP_0202455720 /NCGR_PEP_ID=MMETSP1360-20130828/13179_1 /ASSEMBLY_ACC=CAM_ASM_000848 /TAXON_ID=515479 /ORGANISM="Licmophora paradoxa, Strain CCMP2313" /LENGTH=35 /DNA_ID= /DNA_START= /DNA_END= /DNA_ORIENTATION=